MSKLVIKGSQGWEYVFRKNVGRPVEVLKRHQRKGALGGWQCAKNFCLRALIDRGELAAHFGGPEL